MTILWPCTDFVFIKQFFVSWLFLFHNSLILVNISGGCFVTPSFLVSKSWLSSSLRLIQSGVPAVLCQDLRDTLQVLS